MFIVPCRYISEEPIIFECITSIKQYHPYDKIVVVDSDSSDRSYFDTLRTDFGVEVLDVHNVSYAPGAFRIGYEHYPDEDFYYCIHDSMLVRGSMKQFEVNPLTVLRYFCSPPTSMGDDVDGSDLKIWANEKLQTHIGIPVPDSYYGVFGPIFFAQNKVMKELQLSGYFDIICERKHHASAMERMTGIILIHLGYDPSNNSLQGEMLDFWGKYDNTYAEKVHQLRQ